MEKRFTYDAAFKRKVILCAEKISGRKYTVRHVYVIGEVWKQNCFHVWQIETAFLDKEKEEILRLLPLF
jgi:hypothetical protein